MKRGGREKEEEDEKDEENETAELVKVRARVNGGTGGQREGTNYLQSNNND